LALVSDTFGSGTQSGASLSFTGAGLKTAKTGLMGAGFPNAMKGVGEPQYISLMPFLFIM
jgi:hypothetical protein